MRPEEQRRLEEIRASDHDRPWKCVLGRTKAVVVLGVWVAAGVYKYGNHLTPGLAEVRRSGCRLHLLPG